MQSDLLKEALYPAVERLRYTPAGDREVHKACMVYYPK